MKIDFEHIEVYTDLGKTQVVIANERRNLANVIYNQGQGLAFHALALKIWNGDADTEYTDEECRLMMKVVEACFAPCFIDAMRNLTGKTLTQ
jgi:hypothetical protein